MEQQPFQIPNGLPADPFSQPPPDPAQTPVVLSWLRKFVDNVIRDFSREEAMKQELELWRTFGPSCIPAFAVEISRITEHLRQQSDLERGRHVVMTGKGATYIERGARKGDAERDESQGSSMGRGGRKGGTKKKRKEKRKWKTSE